MSEQMKKLLAVVMVVLVAVIGLDGFGLLPGPVQIPGVHARFGGATDPEVDTTTDGTIDAAAPDCPPTTGADPSATDAPVDPNAAVPADPNGTVPADPNATAPSDPNGTVPTDPAAAPAGASYDATGAAGVDQIVAAGAEPRYATDSAIFAADGAVDPTTGQPIVDDPGADAGAGADVTNQPPVVEDPCANVGTGDAAPGTDKGTAIIPAPNAAKPNPRATSDETSSGNSPEALRMAQEVQKYLAGVQIQTRVQATLLPATGGEAPAARIKPYRGKVTAAALVVTLADPGADQNWKTASKATRSQLIVGFLTRLKNTYPNAARSVSLTDSSGTLLAVGDAAPKAVGSAKVLG